MKNKAQFCSGESFQNLKENRKQTPSFSGETRGLLEPRATRGLKTDDGTREQQPAAKVDQETLTEMVKPSIDYMRHKRFRSGNYPSSLSNETDRLVHWCHGAPGVIHMLMQAYKLMLEIVAYIPTYTNVTTMID
eukprot:bmy_20375T0